MKKSLLLNFAFLISIALSAQDASNLWAFTMGGSGTDIMGGIDTDEDGNTYVTGSVFGPDIDFDPGVDTSSTSAYGWNVFVAKYTSDGDLAWSFLILGSEVNAAYDIAIGLDGNIHVIGAMNGTTNFDPNGVQEITSIGNADGFVATYNPDGELVWVFTIEGVGGTSPQTVDIDSNGDIILGGSMNDASDFDPSSETANMFVDISGVFLAKYTNQGDYVWSIALPNNSPVELKDIEVDGNNHIVATGWFQGTFDMDAGNGSNIYQADGNDAFLFKVNENGEALWGRAFTGSNDDIGNSVEIGPNNDVYFGGRFISSTDADPGVDEVLYEAAVGSDALFVHLDADGNYLNSQSFSTSGDSHFYDIKLNSNDQMVFMGYFNGTINFTDTQSHSSSGGKDVFFLTIELDGEYVRSFTFGGGGDDFITRQSFQIHNNSFLCAGQFYGSLDVGPDAEVQLAGESNGNQDLFLAKFASGGTQVVESENTMFTLYPNPAQDQVAIQGVVNKQVRILDLAGRLVHQSFMQDAQLDISNLESGYYLVLVEGRIARLVIEK